jgi:hypothetical protein
MFPTVQKALTSPTFLGQCIISFIINGAINGSKEGIDWVARLPKTEVSRA